VKTLHHLGTALLALAIFAPAAHHAQAQSGDITEAQADSMAKGNVWAELQKKLDSKKAKVGDAVIAKTSEAVQLGNGTELPKGTKIEGKVTAVNGPSVTFSFTQAVTKDGKTVPVKVLVIGAEVPEVVAMASLSGGMQNSGQTDPNAAAQAGMKPGAIASMQQSHSSGNDDASAGAPGSMTVTGGVMQLKNVPVANSTGLTVSSTTAEGGSASLTGTGKNFSVDNGFKMRLEVLPGQ
jgi:hypothetical protein